MQIKLINDNTPDMLNNMRRQILAKIEGAKNYLQAQEEEKPQDNVKKVKHKLQDNEELVEYLFVDGKRKKKVIRHERRKKGLTKEEASEILKVFSLFDKDGSESIDSYELKDAMKALGIYVDKESLKKLMEKADKDGSGSIERPEFLSLMAELIERRDPKREVEKSFRMYDEDDGGTIDLGNLRKVVHELGYQDFVMDMECLSMIKIADTKQQNAVDLEDFMNVMHKAGLF